METEPVAAVVEEAAEEAVEAEAEEEAEEEEVEAPKSKNVFEEQLTVTTSRPLCSTACPPIARSLGLPTRGT